MGMGVLGRAAATALLPLGFRVAGLEPAGRRPMAGVEMFAGAAQRDAFLARTDILVCLLPLTAETRGILVDAAVPQARHGTARSAGRW